MEVLPLEIIAMAMGEKGSHQEHLYVYGRDGQACRICGTPLEKIKVGGRGTRFCPHCQPLEVES